MASIHYAHYKDFIRCLQEDPDVRFSDYCEKNGISFHGFYKWLQRNKISLKKLYKAYGAGRPMSELMPSDNELLFQEVKPLQTIPASSNTDTDIHGMRMALPGGIAVEIGECSASAALSLLRECLAFGAGKERSYV